MGPSTAPHKGPARRFFIFGASGLNANRTPDIVGQGIAAARDIGLQDTGQNPPPSWRGWGKVARRAARTPQVVTPAAACLQVLRSVIVRRRRRRSASARAGQAAESLKGPWPGVAADNSASLSRKRPGIESLGVRRRGDPCSGVSIGVDLRPMPRVRIAEAQLYAAGEPTSPSGPRVRPSGGRAGSPPLLGGRFSLDIGRNQLLCQRAPGAAWNWYPGAQSRVSTRRMRSIPNPRLPSHRPEGHSPFRTPELWRLAPPPLPGSFMPDPRRVIN
jgi:hypothetical protein